MTQHAHHHPAAAAHGGHLPGAPRPAGEPQPHEGTHAGHDIGMFRRRFWVCLALTLPVLAYADVVHETLGFRPPDSPGAALIPGVLSTLIFVYGGGVFLQGAVRELRRGATGMMTLIALAISVAFVYSLATEFVLPGMPLYWELATLIDVMLLGHWIEMRSIAQAQGALRELARLLPDTAERIVGDRVEEVPVSALRTGDLVLIRPGARIPADGTVVEGVSEVNESMITGESLPAPKHPDDRVLGGAVNGDGSLRVRVTEAGEGTVLSGIMRLVAEAQRSQSRSQVLADRAASWLTRIALVAGALTLGGWLAAGQTGSFAIERMVTVLVIACPHALGLAIPLVVAISTTLAARNGLLVRDRLQLEEARAVNVVVFDKTGTLTRGEQGVVGIATADSLGGDDALALAAALEGDSEHMIARALRAAAEQRGLPRRAVQGFAALPGRGVRGRLDGTDFMVGGPRLLETLEQPAPAALVQQADAWGRDGKTVVYLVRDGSPVAAFALADVVRQESREAVGQLKAMGISVAMLTGDSTAVARWVAADLGIDEFFAEVLPEHKAEKVRELKARGLKVAMVGDGVNDAPALVTADVGIAIGAGTDVAIASAGIILIRNDPRDVVRIVMLSRASFRKMLQNLGWATGYNVVALPLAAGVLAPVGIILAPAFGAVLMSLSTVAVALNAQLLRRLDLHHPQVGPARTFP